MENKAKKGLLVAICTVFVTVCLSLAAACADSALTGGPELPPYDDSGYTGTSLEGTPYWLDMTGYSMTRFTFYEDGSVALTQNTYVPLRNSRTAEGFTAQISVERDDGVFNAMTEAANTGALYVQAEDTEEGNRVRYRIYVVGVDEETSYIVVSGAEQHLYDSGYTYYERRYLIPLGGYCTGAPLNMRVTYYSGAYYILLTTPDGDSVFKKIDGETAYVANANFSSDMDLFFATEDTERVLGIQSLEMKARFSDVSYETGDAAAQPMAVAEKRTVTCINEMPDGGSIAVSESNPDRGETVTVSVKPNDGYYLDSFTVDDVNRKYRLSRGEDGYYVYDLIGVQTDTTVTAVFAAGVETTYTITGTYEYTSGTYNAATDRYENEGDTVTVEAGYYTGTVNADGTFAIDLPEGYYEISLNSNKFPAAGTSLTVNGQTDVGTVRFDRIRFVDNLVYAADGTVSILTQRTDRLIDEVPVSEGFTVSYTVRGSSGGWFNTGGLYLCNADNANDWDFLFVYHSGTNAQIVLIDGNVLWHNGPAYTTSYYYPDCTEEIQVTVIYYNGEYHFILDNQYKCTINASTVLGGTGSLGADFFDAKSRLIGFRTFDSGATFSDISYGLGDAAAQKAMESMYVPVTAEAGGSGSISLFNTAGTAIAADSSQDLGTMVTAEILPDEGYTVDTFTVNGNDRAYELYGPFDRNGRTVYKYTAPAYGDGLDMYVSFTEAARSTYTVSGTYAYDGISGGSVTVAAGGITGTAADGAFTIDLPDGTHVITLTDAAGYHATKEVIVQGGAVDAGEFVFQTVRFVDGAKVTPVENGYRVESGYNLLDNVIASEGFVISYTVKGEATDTWFNTGALYFNMNGVNYSIVVLGKKNADGSVRIGLQQSDRGINSVDYYYSTCDYSDMDAPLEVTVVYYQRMYFVKLGNTEVNVIGGSSNGYINSTFFTEGYRALGFRAWDETGTFTNISVELGNEVAAAAVAGWSADENVDIRYHVGTNRELLLPGEPTAAAGEGFVVSYELGSNTATSWYNHAGLLIRTDAATEAYQRQSIVVQMRSDGTLMIGFGYAGAGNANPTPQMDYSYVSNVIVRTEDGGKTPMRVTVVYYNEAYYVQVEQQNADGVYAVVHAEKWDETRGNYSRGKGLYSSELTRKLGVNGFYAEAVHNFTYEIGNAAAKAAVEDIGYNPEENNYRVPNNTEVYMRGDPMTAPGKVTTAAGEGFTVRFTAPGKASNNTNWFSHGGLYIETDAEGNKARQTIQLLASRARLDLRAMEA